MRLGFSQSHSQSIGPNKVVRPFLQTSIKSNLVIDRKNQGKKITSKNKYLRKEVREGIEISIFFV